MFILSLILIAIAIGCISLSLHLGIGILKLVFWLIIKLPIVLIGYVFGGILCITIIGIPLGCLLFKGCTRLFSPC